MGISHVEHFTLYSFVFELIELVHFVEEFGVDFFLILRWCLCFHLLCDNCEILFLGIFEAHRWIVLYSLHGFSGHVHDIFWYEFSRVECLLRLHLLLFVVDLNFLRLIYRKVFLISLKRLLH